MRVGLPRITLDLRAGVSKSLTFELSHLPLRVGWNESLDVNAVRSRRNDFKSSEVAFVGLGISSQHA